MLSFHKAPLIEVIAEVRWDFKGQAISAPVAGQFPVMVTDGSHEALFSGLKSGLSAIGFEQSERLAPPGFPSLPNQPIMRFRGSGKSSVLQVGLGNFSINTTQPYRSWESLRPLLFQVLTALMEARMKCGLGSIVQVLLRYVNLFDSSLAGQRNANEFMSDIAAVKVQLPEVLRRPGLSNHDVGLNLQISMKLDWGASLKFNTTDAIINGKKGVLLDLTIAAVGLTIDTPEEIVELLDRSHEELNRIFMALTRPLHQNMEPVRI